MMENARPSRQVYPLSVLFILIAACSIVAAFLAPVARAIATGPVGVTEAAMAAIAGSLSTALLGAVVGVYHYRRRRGLMWGLLTGLLLGAVLGPVSLAPLDVVPSLFSMSAAGAALLIAVAAFFRWSKRPEPAATVVSNADANIADADTSD